MENGKVVYLIVDFYCPSCSVTGTSTAPIDVKGFECPSCGFWNPGADWVASDHLFMDAPVKEIGEIATIMSAIKARKSIEDN